MLLFRRETLLVGSMVSQETTSLISINKTLLLYSKSYWQLLAVIGGY
jgi:hypothetical protein